MPALPHRLARYRGLIGLALAVVLLDQVTKFWIEGRLPLHTFGAPGHIEIIPGFFNLVHVANTGAAWSLLVGRSALLAVLAVITLVAIAVWRRALGLELRSVQVAFGLLCGGIVGNLIDRLRLGHVVDFLDFHFGSYIYPTFNVADCGIVCGVALYLLLNLLAARGQKQEGEKFQGTRVK